MKIWFNRWFSTVYHYINSIKNNTEGIPFEIYGTHPDPNAVYLTVCDVAGVEPDINGEEYIEFCLKFCKENGIEIFVPRKAMVDIANNIKRFEEIGTKVLVCPDGELMKKIDNKALMYEELKGKGIVEIPEYRVVNNVHDFIDAYSELKAIGKKVCFKPVHGEGGFGFRIIDETADSLESLYGPINHKITFKQAVHTLSQVETFPEIMVLELLEEREYSIDCLGYEGHLLAAVPRCKSGGRVRELQEKEELLEIARKITEKYRIPFVYNIQVKYQEGVPKLLEINPRMSGGLHITCLSGVDFPFEAIKLLIGKEVAELHPKLNIRSTYVERPCILEQ